VSPEKQNAASVFEIPDNSFALYRFSPIVRSRRRHYLWEEWGLTCPIETGLGLWPVYGHRQGSWIFAISSACPWRRRIADSQGTLRCISGNSQSQWAF